MILQITQICILITLMAVHTHSAAQGPLALLQPVRHEMRFSKFELTFNSSYGRTIENGFKQYYDVQLLDFHVEFFHVLNPTHMTSEIVGCKEQYIDCYNIRTYDIINYCDNIKAALYFAKINYNNRPPHCPYENELIVRNLTINMDAAKNIFFSPTERYWERCYKHIWKVYDGTSFVVRIDVFFCFLTFRNRSRKNQKN